MGCVEQVGMYLTRETQCADGGDVGMGDVFTEPIGADTLCAVSFKGLQGGSDLCVAEIYPDGGKGRYFQRGAAGRAGTGDQRVSPTNGFVEMVENAAAVHQSLAIIQYQSGHAYMGIDLHELSGIAQGRPGPMFERQSVQPHRDDDPAHEGGVILTDQDHRLFKTFVEIIAFVIDDNECWEIFHFDTPNGFHTEFGIFQWLHLADTILRKTGAVAADAS